MQLRSFFQVGAEVLEEAVENALGRVIHTIQSVNRWKMKQLESL